MSGQENFLYEWLDNEKVKGLLLQLKLAQAIFSESWGGSCGCRLASFRLVDVNEAAVDGEEGIGVRLVGNVGAKLFAHDDLPIKTLSFCDPCDIISCRFFLRELK